jgi:hypothetical protein
MEQRCIDGVSWEREFIVFLTIQTDRERERERERERSFAAKLYGTLCILKLLAVFV